METARVAAEATQQRHLDALSQLEANRTSAGPSQFPPHQIREWSLEDFLQHHPTKFNGKVSPDEVDQWMKDMERVFEAKRCPAENRLAYTVYMLTGEAEHWWASMKMMLEEKREEVSWDVFKKCFLTEYFPDSIWYAKKVEFLQLVQGNMSVAEYTKKIKHLGRFHTIAVDEEWRCRKFENGLRGDIKLMVVPLSIKDFPTLVEKARVMEKLKAEVEVQQRQEPHRVGGPSGFRVRLEERIKPYSRPQPQGFRGASSQQ